MGFRTRKGRHGTLRRKLQAVLPGIRLPIFLDEIGYREIVEHASDDDLERCAIRTLPDAELGQLEEHLLICSARRERLDETARSVRRQWRSTFRLQRTQREASLG